jgi:anti-sigma28 factor (negative regulator of flagellin synthesis)
MMRIGGSAPPQGIDSNGPSRAPRPAAAETGSEHYQTTDLLAISAAAAAASSGTERVNQLKLQVNAGEYHQSSAGIAQRLITGALARND